MAGDLPAAGGAGHAAGKGFFDKKVVGGVTGGTLVVILGGAMVVALYFRRRKSSSSSALTAAAQQAAATQAAQDQLYGGGSGTGVVTPTPTPAGGAGYQDNISWQQAAVSWLIAHGYDSVVANQAVGDYLAGNTLTTQEHALINLVTMGSAVGPPPIAPPPSLTVPPPITTPAPVPTPVPSNKTVKPGEVIRVQYDVAPGQAAAVASKFGISLQHLQNENPGKNLQQGGVFYIPYQVQRNDTNSSVAAKFGISVQHLQLYLP